MKVFHLLSIPNLAEPMKATEFVYNQKFVEPGSLLIPLEKRVPPQKDMPIINPKLMKDPSLERSYKFVSEMNMFDQQLIIQAYRHALAASADRLHTRHQIDERERARRADEHAIAWEIESQRFSIARGWMKRFHMEKVFEHLKIKTMDDLKHLVHIIHERTDIRNNHMHHVMLKQRNQDLGQFLSPIEWARVTGRDEEMIRIKIDLQHKGMLSVNDMQLRLAQQGAAEAMTRIQQNEKLLNTHTGQVPLMKKTG